MYIHIVHYITHKFIYDCESSNRSDSLTYSTYIYSYDNGNLRNKTLIICTHTYIHTYIHIYIFTQTTSIRYLEFPKLFVDLIRTPAWKNRSDLHICMYVCIDTGNVSNKVFKESTTWSNDVCMYVCMLCTTFSFEYLLRRLALIVVRYLAMSQLYILRFPTFIHTYSHHLWANTYIHTYIHT